jgi:hypothetical protein
MRRATHKLELENWELGREAMEFKQPKKGLSFKGKKSATSEWRRRVRKRRHSGNRTLQSTKGGGCHLYIKEDDGRRREATDGRTVRLWLPFQKCKSTGKLRREGDNFGGCDVVWETAELRTMSHSQSWLTKRNPPGNRTRQTGGKPKVVRGKWRVSAFRLDSRRSQGPSRTL